MRMRYNLADNPILLAIVLVAILALPASLAIWVAHLRGEKEQLSSSSSYNSEIYSTQGFPRASDFLTNESPPYHLRKASDDLVSKEGNQRIEPTKSVVTVEIKEIRWGPLVSTIVADGKEFRILSETQIVFRNPGGYLSPFPGFLQPGMLITTESYWPSDRNPRQPEVVAERILVH